ncbi:LL-diaminopimelate aminotransferase [Sporanaerobium hydrogeniformans]|uniref:LL-diaminopimelate aminotransferase n=1 Tax=Sporanaerobium hydrogeniformans TaxID=3072179 RepID=A0AC61DFR7_9FIRM|nr:aminotransferase class I/II-fold pyridoxal phosphate-dependent enzyme [Sporanaerobium hydrogeniformans]PHV71422.1 LL-diaminopimelate aminotransferase [Sporanaerobium hydrogeniformans]
MIFSKKMTSLSSAIFSELNYKKAELMAQGYEMIDFSIGTPDIPPSPQVMTLLQEECSKLSNYKYAINDTPELLEAVTSWYKHRYDVNISSQEVVSLLGSQSGFAELALCLIDPGDTVLVPVPSYPIFRIGPLLAGAQLHKMPLLKENNFLIDLDAIDEEVARKAKLMIVSYPNNPTTAIAPRDFYIKLVAFAKKYDIIVLHDNAYSELLFDGSVGESFLSIKGAKDIGIEFNSLSKTYSIPGCRIAFAIGNQEIIKGLRILKSHVDYGMFLPFQKVATALLTGSQDYVEVVRHTYYERGKVLVEGLREIGWDIPLPQGSMFVWAPIPKHYTSSLDFTYDLMNKAHVMVVPGISFGEEGEGFVRIALVETEDTIRRAIKAIKKSGLLEK